MQYAVIQSGGKQHLVRPGDVCQLEKLPGEVGEEIQFDRVLMVGSSTDNEEPTHVGRPYVEGCRVVGTMLGHGRGDKIEILRYKRRKKWRHRQGHRQHFTTVRVDTISVG